MLSVPYAMRRENLKKILAEHDMKAMLISLDANRYYLSGFELHDAQINESSGYLLINTQGDDWLCTDARFAEAGQRIWTDGRLLIYRKPAEEINHLLKSEIKGSIGFEAEVTSVDFFQKISNQIHFVPADKLIRKLRMLKDGYEIEQMRASCSLNHALMAWLPSVLVPGRTEKQISWDIEQFFRNHGAEELAFPSIVGIDENAALPHAIPSNKPITENCSILIDVGCRFQSYCSDQTRSFWIGEQGGLFFREDLHLVQNAQKQAIAAIRPGISCAEIYHTAKNYLTAHHVDQLFTHGLGHGIGLQTHEAPSLNPQNETVLQAGMIITIEPGLYRAGKSGVRWEHMVLVTEAGAEIL